MSTPVPILEVTKDPDPEADLLFGFNWTNWLTAGDAVGDGQDSTTAPVWAISRDDGSENDGLLVSTEEFVESGIRSIIRLHTTDVLADDLNYFVRCRIKSTVSAESPIRTLLVKVRKT